LNKMRSGLKVMATPIVVKQRRCNAYSWISACQLVKCGYICVTGGQTQDFTKTFASSQTGNKAPPAGNTLYTSTRNSLS